jgi:hypothetical protein
MSPLSHDGMSISRSERGQDSRTRPLLTSFHVLSICRKAAIHWFNLLIHSQKIASKVSELISSRNFQTLERSSSADPNCCPWRRLLRCGNKKQNKSEGAKSGESSECGAIRKKLASQNTFVTFTVCSLALSACMHNQPPFTSLSTPSNGLSENISDIVGGREHLSFWHDINNLESMAIPDER